MANKETTYTIKLDAEIGNLTASAEKVKKALSGIGALGKFPELDRGLEAVFKKLDKIKETAASPVKNSTFTSLGKDAAAIGVQLTKLFDTLTKLARNTDGAALDILPPDVLQKLKDASSAMSAYNATIDAAAQKTKELVNAENALSAAEGRLEGWRNKLADATAAKNNASQTLAATREELQAAQQRIEATRREVEERREAIKELEALYESQGADKRKELVDDKGNVRNLRKEKNSLARLEGGIPEQEQTIASLSEQITAGEKAVKSYSDRILECNNQIGNWTAAVERNREAVRALNEAFEDNKIIAAKKAYADLRKEAEKLGVDISDLPLEGTADDMAELEDRVASLGEGIEKLAVEQLNNAKQGFEGSEKAVNDLKDGIKDAKVESDEFNESQRRLDSIKNNIKQFIGWAGAAKVLSAALRNAFQDIKELDKAMTEIAVVTDFKIGDMWDQLPQYTDRANELGLSITQVYEASALFYQQGLDTNEMVALSNETLKMAKIAGLDAAEATDRMTAALRGFNMELNQESAQKVADVYSQLAAITASDVDEISTAMTKTASIASSAGMEFETTAAFLSQIIETTRESAETAGTAMKTVIARFQELKKAPEDIEEVDGEIIDANQIEKALRSVGVSLRDAKGEFRELDDVFLELSSKWGGLDKNTQRYIATIAAGSRQQSRFIAMMSNYERTQELVTAANNSAGASAKQYAKTLESIETKLTQLDNAWTEFSTGLMNSGFVKAAVDFLTFLLNSLNKATEGFGSFTSSLTKIGVLVAVFQTAKNLVSKFFDEVIQKVYISAKQAGENIAKGTQDGLNNAATTTNTGMIGNIREGYSMVMGGLSKNDDGERNITAARKQVATLTKQATENEEKYRQAINAAGNDEEKLAAIEEERSKQLEQEKQAMEEAQRPIQQTTEGIDKMAQAAQAAAQAVTFAGVGISILGQAISNSGAEEAGEVISKIGSGIATIGTVLMGLVPVAQLVATQIAKSGVKAMLPWLAVIVTIGAVIGIVAAVANAIKQASPEYKMEKLAEAADKSAEAAERAEKAYENLKEAFDGLENGYKALENLTKGTEEWNEAVKQINHSVLDLIQQYPELAQLVDNEGGVLTLDMDSEAVQQVLKEVQKSAIIAQNSVNMANLNVARSEDDVEYKNMDQDQKIGHSETSGDTTYWVEEKENTKALAKALASGTIVDTGSEYKITDAEAAARLGIEESSLKRWYSQIDQSSNELKEYGESLLETEEQGEAAFAAVAASAMQLANTLTMTEEQISQAGNVVDDATVQGYYDEKMDEIEDIDFTVDNGLKSISDDQKKMRDEAIKAQYGGAARIEGNTVTFRDAEGKQQTEKLTNDEIQAIIANNYATTQTANAIEMAPAVIDKVISNLGYEADSEEAKAIEAVTQDQEGGNLTKAQKDELLAMDTDALKDAYSKLTDEQKKVFGTEQDYLDKIQGAAEIADAAFKEAEASASKMGFELKSWMVSEMATGFTNKLEQVLETTGEAGVQQVLEAYNALIEGKDEAVAAEITALMNGIDWTNQEALLSLQLELEARYGYTTEEASNLTEAIGEAADATSSLAHTVRVFDELYHATQRLNAALEKTENLQWDYERALKNGADETELSLNLEKQRASLENEVRTALEAYELALEAQVNAYARGADIRSDLGTTAQELVSYDEKTGTYDLTRLQQYIDAGEFGGEESESYKAVTDYVNELEEANKTAKDHLKTAKSSYQKLEQLQETYDSAYVSMYSQLEDAISTILEQELEVQREILETEQEANDKLIGKIQEDINERRADRDKEKTEEALNDLSTRLAYLKADSSGANALEIAELEKQLADEQQSYQDSLVDDAISDLEDANEKAAEQRDIQIALAEQQLEIYKKSDAFQDQIKSKLDEYLNSYNAHVDAVRKYEAHQAAYEIWDKSTTEEREKYQAAYDAKISGNWDDYTKKYGATSEEELTKFASIAESSFTIAEDPGGWDAASTPLGTILETAGVTTGMNRLEKDQFWESLGKNTANAANSSKLTSDNTGGEAGTTEELLDQIEQHTAEAAYYDLKTRQEVSLADSRATIASDILGFTFKNTANTNENGEYISGSDTTKYIEDMTQISNLTSQNNKFKETIATGRSEAVGLQERLEQYGLSSGIGAEQAYYNKFTPEDMLSLRGSLAEGNTNSELLWANAVKNDYKSQVEAWTTGTGINSFIKELKKIVESGHRDGFEGLLENAATNGLAALRDKYVALNKNTSKEEASNIIVDKIKELTAKWDYGSIDSDGDDGYVWGNKWKLDAQEYELHWDDANAKSKYSIGHNFLGEEPQNNWIIASGSNLYSFQNGKWRPLKIDEGDGQAYKEAFFKKLREGNYTPTFKTGGLADFTGPAWLDGTKSRPEYVLNSDQTERFFQLIDVLDRQSMDTAGERSNGDNYFDIDINVESLESDYDVEQIAAKIRAIIVEDASYRNVNNISLTH